MAAPRKFWDRAERELAGSGAAETVVAVYSSEASAQAACRDLQDNGVSADSIRRYSGVKGAAAFEPQYQDSGSLMDWLLGEESPVPTVALAAATWWQSRRVRLTCQGSSPSYKPTLHPISRSWAQAAADIADGRRDRLLSQCCERTEWQDRRIDFRPKDLVSG
jgi:hypothetical protein